MKMFFWLLRLSVLIPIFLTGHLSGNQEPGLRVGEKGVPKNGRNLRKNKRAANKKLNSAHKEMEDLEAMGWEIQPHPFLPMTEKEFAKTPEIAAADAPEMTIQAPLGGALDQEGEQTLPPAPSLEGDLQPEKKNLPADSANIFDAGDEEEVPQEETKAPLDASKSVIINFNNIQVIEYIRFVSRLSGKNFVVDEADLDFNVTVVSEEPATVESILAALIQELRSHDLTILEEGNNIVIHKNPNVSNISAVGAGNFIPQGSEVVTQVFHLNTLDPAKAAAVIRPLTSTVASVEVLEKSNNMIVTDLVNNVKQIAQLIRSLDAPSGGLVVGQYVVKYSALDAMVDLAQQLMLPIAQEQEFTLVPHEDANSIFIVSTPFLVEKTISVLQRLDQRQGMTRIYEMHELKLQGEVAGAAEGKALPGIAMEKQGMGKWDLDTQGNWIFKPVGVLPEGEEIPAGKWYKDGNGNWHFVPEGAPSPFAPEDALERAPEGDWEKDEEKNWVFRLGSGESISAEPIFRHLKPAPDLPLGDIERTKFFIHKLQYRKGSDIQQALSQIATSLQQLGTGNEDLIATIETVQWLEASNSLIFTGTATSIRKVEELIAEIDTPLRQVFIEMLILDSSLDESLNYGVNWGTRYGGGNSAGSQAFLSAASNLPGGLDTAGIASANGVSTGEVLTPSGSSLARTPGYNLGIVGQSVSLGNLTFQTFGALVKAIHDRTGTNIVMNPKILAEDNVTAEVFVGLNTQYQTQSISNDQGSVITTNFEYRNVGTTLKITPFLGSNNIITLEIKQEVSSVASTTNAQALNNISPGPTTRLSRTTTRVHVPDKYFLVISGMVQDQETRRRVSIPCLGGLPIIGAAFSDKNVIDEKRNLMIFIRPQIIDTEEEIQKLTKHQQDIFRYKNQSKRSWKYEVDEALDFFNLRSTEKYETGAGLEASLL
ncbi:secretin N-terminal domain-containing protein [Parachlamydia sp. AcF125]|uniref:secretin N-terminal domain-containing protein n=1 Tax=Parachlamydia sp. AcF125 TaxID=2795736 RepID=UPI001BCA573C|nr:secretin N-terminal domain-containing protein [Parachlamydia sp. AcF125]MBS4168174.1 Type II secretion system protein D [Parachlamydia sp. AcF125]